MSFGVGKGGEGAFLFREFLLPCLFFIPLRGPRYIDKVGLIEWGKSNYGQGINFRYCTYIRMNSLPFSYIFK